MKLLYYLLYYYFCRQTINFDRSNLYKIKNTYTHTYTHTQVDISNIIETSSCELSIGVELQIVSNTLIHSRHLGKYRFWWRGKQSLILDWIDEFPAS